MIYKALGYGDSDIEDILRTRGVSMPTLPWKNKKNLLAIYGKKTKFSSAAH